MFCVSRRLHRWGFKTPFNRIFKALIVGCTDQAGIFSDFCEFHNDWRLQLHFFRSPIRRKKRSSSGNRTIVDATDRVSGLHLA